MATATKTDEIPPIANDGAFSRKLDDICRLREEIAQGEQELTDRLNAIRAEFEPALKPKRDKLATWEAQAADYAQDYRDHLFGEGSTFETKVSRMTLRDCPPSVVLKRGVNEADAIENLEAEGLAGAGMVIVKRALGKPAIKSALLNAAKETRDKIRACGLLLKRGVSIKIEPKGD